MRWPEAFIQNILLGLLVNVDLRRFPNARADEVASSNGDLLAATVGDDVISIGLKADSGQMKRHAVNTDSTFQATTLLYADASTALVLTCMTNGPSVLTNQLEAVTLLVQAWERIRAGYSTSLARGSASVNHNSSVLDTIIRSAIDHRGCVGTISVAWLRTDRTRSRTCLVQR